MSEDSNSSVARRAETPSESDAELRAAVERMQAALGHDGDTLERLRAGLADLALAVARAKALEIEPEAAAPGKLDVAALLNEFEARVAGLIALVDVPVQNAAEDDAVPTVSHVVSRLGRGEEATPTQSADVSALGAMVEKLAASMFPEPPPQADAASSDAVPPAAEPELPQPPLLPELDLMSNFARMESVPHLPAEIGTAVIFEPKPPEPVAEPQEAPAAEIVAPPAPEAAIESTDLDPAGILDQPPAPGTDADGDPAGFLLEPLPAAAPPVTAPEPAPIQPQPKIPHDPLAPLKALSDVEKIALFS